MPKKDHTQDFLNELKEELKKDKLPKDPRVDRLIERSKTLKRPIPPSLLVSRLSHINMKSKNREGEGETWMSLVSLIYELWVEENYPEEEP